MLSFAGQKFVSLIRLHLFTFAFISFALGDRLKKNTALIYVRVFCLFSSRSFMVSSLTFRSSTHFEFIFVYSVTEFLISLFYK